MWRKTTAHRWAYTVVHGPVDRSLVMDHYRWPGHGCIGRRCVNPEHVRPVTHRENVLRGDTPSARALARETCEKGHHYGAQPRRRKASGKRVCRICDNEQAQAKVSHCTRGHDYATYGVF